MQQKASDAYVATKEYLGVAGEKASETADKAGQQAGATWDATKQKANEAADQANAQGGSAWDATKQKATEVGNRASE